MKKNKKTLLWKISGKDLPGDSYLFGTMHVRSESAFLYQSQVYDKINHCDAFATEFNLEEMMGGTSEATMDLPDGQTLDQLLSPKQYKKVDKLFQKVVGASISHFNTSLPLLVSNVLTEQLLSAEMPVSIDMDLWNYARENDKIVLGVETYQEQINILKKIPLDYQLQSLVATVKDFKSHGKQLKKLTTMYLDADIDKLYKSTKKSLQGLRKILLYNRNEIMATRIAALASEQTICVAIGAGHLSGGKGVLRLLKKEGLKVSPVKLYKEALPQTSK